MSRTFGVLAALALTVVATACSSDEGADATSSTSSTAWGLPIDTAPIS